MELTRTFPAAKTPISIAIIGCGSRGLTVLERLCALASLGDTPVDIHVYEPNRPGPGVHSLQQPECLMLNTVASQISMFPDSAALGGKSGVVGREGPDFFQWCQRYKSAVRTVRANEFLPRQWLGEYLAWTYDNVIRNVPAHVRVNHYPSTVDNIQRGGLDGFALTSSQGEIRDADCLVVTVGHATAPRVVDNIGAVTRMIAAYPQPLAFEGIAPGERVGIEGLGLCAMDVVAGLTVGRGGRFVGEGATLRYEPSGDEPKLFMFSRSGVPYRTRPDIYEHRRASPAQIFTLSAVSKLRASNPGGLDFERQVLPLIKAEMFAEYFGMVARLQGDASALIKDEIAHAFHHGVLESKAAELAVRFGVSELARSVFDPDCLHVPVESYQQWVRNLIEEDLAESIADLDHSPIKAAIEVWRTCREQLRRVVDNRGLTAEAHATFFGHYAPLVNRMVAGPQKERHQELLALAEAGVLQWVHASRIEHDKVIQGVHVAAVDNQPEVVLDALVVAHVGDNSGDDGHPDLIRRLKASGFIHSKNADRPGLQVDGHGKASAKLWITGPLVEGATYYNHYVPSSGSYSRAFVDANRIAREMLGMTGSEPKPVDTFEPHETELALA
jgi:hypothetical protein